VAEGYRAMDERRAIKTLLTPSGPSDVLSTFTDAGANCYEDISFSPDFNRSRPYQFCGLRRR
jgi:hypothetical protein